MIKKTFLAAIAAPALLTAALAFSASPAVAASSSFTATLTGASEPSGGDASATGSATVTVDTTSGQVCATVTSDVSGAVAMHVHKGAAGVSGPVVVALDAKKINAGSSCATVPAALAGQIAAGPAGFYVNVHTPALPKGAIRGQLAAQASSVGAGSGGYASTGSGPNQALLILVVFAGAAVVGAAGWRLARR